jgi:cold shock protein
LRRKVAAALAERGYVVRCVFVAGPILTLPHCPPADIGVRHKTSIILVVRDRRLRLPFCFWRVIICAAEANSIGADMSKGTVKWFNSQKGYGFIQPQGGGKDVFVHISAVERAGLSGLNEGQVIEYEEVSNRGKTSAEHLKVQR